MNSILQPSIMVLIIIVLVVYILTKEVNLYLKRYIKACETGCPPEKIPMPEEIFKAIGAEVKEKSENEDHTFSNYVIAYQGGYFTFTLSKDSRWMDIAYLGFERCKYEYLNKVLMVVNNLNYQFGGWSCHLSLSSDEKDERPLNINLAYRLVLNGNLNQITDSLKQLLEQAFFVARDFSAQLKEKISKQEEVDDEFFNSKTFNHKISYIQRLKETDHLDGLHEEFTDSSVLSINRLIKYFDNVDFGCLRDMRIINGSQVNEINDLDEIQTFDIREYIRKQPDVVSIKSLSFVIGFERQELFINLTKKNGATERSLFYDVNIVCSGCELNDYMDNRFPSHVRTLLEVRLTDAEQDYWEAKYMIDEAMDKSKSGQMNDLSDEQRLVLAIVQPSLQLDLYWGKKFYNKQCYFQALYHFNRVFENLRKNCNSWNDNVRNLYDEISYYIGFIYTDLKMYDRAFYYLWPAQSNGDINATYEFVNCLCNMKDVGAKGYISSKAKEVTELMNKSEEEVERLLPLYNFLRRRYVYALIDRAELDEAEEMLNEMIKEEQDLEFANGELEYIKAIKENAQGDFQKETDK